MSDDYTYFDETYFQDGREKGTVYSNYLEAARTSVTYKDIARRVVEIFRPRRCLEIGCATGIIVKHINDLGCEAHGIDVSEWAVNHREHSNISLAGAETLPFADDEFDLVFSCHSLEHIPFEKKDAAFSEMTRVCSRGFQFHMLPIIGMGLYKGDPVLVAEELRRDPTHNLLFDKERWLSEWARFGWVDTGLRIALSDDTPYFDLSDSQYLLLSGRVPDDIRERVEHNNFSVARELYLRLQAVQSALAEGRMNLPPFNSKGGKEIIYGDEPLWKSAEVALDWAPADLTEGLTVLAIVLEGKVPTFRISVGSGYSDDPWTDCAERYLSLKQGLNCCALRADDFSTLRGQPDFRAIRHVSLGGTGAGTAALRCWCVVPGAVIF
jgi:SAM-dependent methyltransferase